MQFRNPDSSFRRFKQLGVPLELLCLPPYCKCRHQKRGFQLSFHCSQGTEQYPMHKPAQSMKSLHCHTAHIWSCGSLEIGAPPVSQFFLQGSSAHSCWDVAAAQHQMELPGMELCTLYTRVMCMDIYCRLFVVEWSAC